MSLKRINPINVYYILQMAVYLNLINDPERFSLQQKIMTNAAPIETKNNVWEQNLLHFILCRTENGLLNHLIPEKPSKNYMMTAYMAVTIPQAINMLIVRL